MLESFPARLWPMQQIVDRKDSAHGCWVGAAGLGMTARTMAAFEAAGWVQIVGDTASLAGSSLTSGPRQGGLL